MEVNSTFYSPLPGQTLTKWAKTMKGRNFQFSIKVPASITHKNLIGKTSEACSEMQNFEKTHLDFLEGEGILGAVLFQLPPFFNMEHLDKLILLLSSFEHGRFVCFVEPRNGELYHNKEFSRAISTEGAYITSVDSPEIGLEQNIHAESGKSYIRLHGRNHKQWFVKGSDKLQKYDYLYSKEELETFVKIISPLASKGDEIFIFFNNHPSGKAPANAIQIMEMLGIPPHFHQQRTLF